MTSIALTATDPAALAVDAVVVGVYAPPGSATPPARQATPVVLQLAPGAETIDAAFSGELTQIAALLGATGTTGDVVKIATLGSITAPLVAVVGLGEQPHSTAPESTVHETLRRAAGAALRALAGQGSVALALPSDVTSSTREDASGAGARLAAAATGALLGAYQFSGYKTTPNPRTPVAAVTLVSSRAGDPGLEAQVQRAAIIAAAVATARDWVNQAPNLLRPPHFAEAIAAAAGRVGLDVEILDETALEAGGYGGIIAVGKGSEAPPRLLRLAYRTTGSTVEERPTIALIGKGITFDSGGVSIKPAAGMAEMKSDMAGAAAIAATMLAIAELRPAVDVTAYLPLAENMPSGSSYRPGDVITMFNGTRVEVLNTDAEGRMILADAIARACQENPTYLFETSTLTGGQVVALGKRVSGLMGTAELCERVKAAGERVGELSWPMPLPEEVRTGMSSEVADISQVNATMDRAGHMLQGGVFLSEFVTDGVAWTHIDVAGPAYNSGDAYGYIPKGGTGIPLRTLIEMIDEIATRG